MFWTVKFDAGKQIFLQLNSQKKKPTLQDEQLYKIKICFSFN